MLGIKPLTPGFEAAIVAPRPGPGVTWARGTHRTIRGLLESGWEVTPAATTYRIVIPPNVKAKVVLPAASAENISEGGSALAKTKDLKVERAEGGFVTLEVGSGEYRFTVVP